MFLVTNMFHITNMPHLTKLCLQTILILTLSVTPLLAKDQNWVGKIWSTKEARFVLESELNTALQQSRYILLGETHDNPEHHRLQAKLIKQMVQTSKQTNTLPPAIVMEMIRVDQMPRLESYLNSKDPKAEHLGTALQWRANGWPDWAIYQPIGEQILKHKLDVYPGMASRRLNNYLIKNNIFSLPEASQKKLKLDVKLSPKLAKSLQEEIKAAHCNKLPARVIMPMANVQRFRDAWMADVMITAATDQKSPRQVILIAGSGHTRTDRGAPWYLRKRQAEGHNKILSIQFAEIPETQNKNFKIKDITAQTPEGTPAADYIWITPRQKRGNYCDHIPDFGKNNR